MVKKTLLIRADASSSIGMGHRVRCQILADEFTKKGWSVCFVSHVSCRLLANDSDITIKHEDEFLILAATANLVILDHYAYDSVLIERLYQHQPNLFLLDDMNDRGALFCRWLLNPVALDYNENLERLMREHSQSSTLFTGIQFALLRRQFTVDVCSNQSLSSPKIKTVLPPKSTKKLLITMGGTDPLGLTLPVLIGLNALGFDANDLIVMLGSKAKNSVDVMDYCQRHNIDYQQNVTDVALLMRSAKMAISAGGSTLFELAATSVPSLFLQVADNQTKLLNEYRNTPWCRVYRLDNQLLDERDKLITQACQQAVLDWGDDAYLCRAYSELDTLKVGLKALSIVAQVENTVRSGEW